MRTSARPAAVSLRAIFVLVVVLIAVVSGGFLLHGYRKQAAVKEALASGLAAYEAGDYAKAAADLDRYLMANSRNIEIRLKYADAQMRIRPQTPKTIKQAVSALETVLRLQPGHSEAAGTLAQLYLVIDAPIDAERVSRSRLETDPDDSVAQRHLAAALIGQRKYEDAIEILEALVASEPYHVQSTSTLAFLLLRHKNDTQACRELLDGLVKHNPDSTAARVARARFYLATGQREQADTDLEAAEKLRSDDPTVLLTLGRILSTLGLQRRAAAQFDLAEQVAPADPAVYNARARIALNMGDFEAGAAVADRALAARLGERRYDVLLTAAELYAGANRTDDARKCTEELRAAGAPPQSIQYLDALVALAEGKSYEGIAALEEVVRRNPKHARAHLMLGRGYAATGQMRRATGPFKECIRLDDGSAVAVQLQLARVYAALDRWTEALGAAAEAQRQAPSSLSAEMTRIEIEGLVAKPDGSRPDPATLIRLYEQARDLSAQHPNDLGPRILLARLAAWQGQLPEAGQILNTARKDLENASLPATMALVTIYADAGEYEKAIAECTAALTLVGQAQSATLRGRLAQLHADKGDIQRARELMEQLAADETSRPARSAARVKLARLLLQHNKEDQARSCLIQVADEDDGNVPSRLMLLAMKPDETAGPSRQQLVDQLKRIEGEHGLNWRYLQARIWMERDEWARYRQKIEALLDDCLAKDPGWTDAALALGQMHEKAGEAKRAMTVYREALQTDPQHVELARRLLTLAARADRWAEVDRLLDLLPPGDPMSQQYSIVRALRQGDTDRVVQMLEAHIKADVTDFMSRLQLAALLREEKDTVRAERLLAEAVRIAPDAPQVLIARVEACLRRSEFGQALTLCDQALAKTPSPQAHAYALRARVHEMKGDLALAENDLREFTQLDGMREKGFLALGQLRLRHGKLPEAIEAWREGLAAAGESFPIRVAMASAMLAHGDEPQRQAATAMLEKLLTERPDDETLLMLRADHLRETDPAQAERIYEEITRARPTASGAFLRLVQMAFERGRREQALERVERGLGSNPRNVNLLLMKCALLWANSPNRAAVAAREALTIEPDNEAAVIALAKALAASGDRGKAFEALETFLAREGSPQKVNARLALANLHLLAGEFEQADALIQQASKFAPDAPSPVQTRLVWHRAQSQWDPCAALAHDRRQSHPDDVATANLAAHLLMQSKEARHRQDAKQLLEHVVKRRPRDPESHAELGSVCYLIGQMAEAKAAFERGLEVDPDNVRLLNDLAWLLSEDQGDPQAAAKWAGKAIESGSDDPTLLDTWGVVQYRLGNLEPSRDVLERCLAHPRIRPGTRIAAQFHLARTLATLDKPRSRELLEAVLADPATERVLPPADREEARQLQQRLGTVQPPGPKTQK